MLSNNSLLQDFASANRHRVHIYPYPPGYRSYVYSIMHYIDVIYPKELEIEDTTDGLKWANYLDLHLEFDEDNKLFTRLYDTRDDFDFGIFPIVYFPYLSSNIPESPACGVCVSQLIHYARVCLQYEDFLFRGSILVSKLLKQGYSSRK